RGRRLLLRLLLRLGRIGLLLHRAGGKRSRKRKCRGDDECLPHANLPFRWRHRRRRVARFDLPAGAAAGASRVGLSAGAFSMTSRSIALAAPAAGRFDCQVAAWSSARISGKSCLLLTLSGANVVMSKSPDHSSRCLMRSQLLLPSVLPRLLP